MQTSIFKTKLEAEKVRLESEMAMVGRRNPRVPGDWESALGEAVPESDVVDQADAIVNRENNEAVLSALEARYDTIVKALDKIAKKTYGVCEACGAPIEPARLTANPAAATCAAHMH